MKHTAGPWSIDPRASNHVIAPSRPICSVSFRTTALPDGGSAENEANARLIAAAPDLLASAEECERILKFAFEEGTLSEETVMGLCIDPFGVLADLRAAIAKATGQDKP